MYTCESPRPAQRARQPGPAPLPSQRPWAQPQLSLLEELCRHAQPGLGPSPVQVFFSHSSRTPPRPWTCALGAPGPACREEPPLCPSLSLWSRGLSPSLRPQLQKQRQEPRPRPWVSLVSPGNAGQVPTRGAWRDRRAGLQGRSHPAGAEPWDSRPRDAPDSCCGVGCPGPLGGTADAASLEMPPQPGVQLRGEVVLSASGLRVALSGLPGWALARGPPARLSGLHWSTARQRPVRPPGHQADRPRGPEPPGPCLPGRGGVVSGSASSAPGLRGHHSRCLWGTEPGPGDPPAPARGQQRPDERGSPCQQTPAVAGAWGQAGSTPVHKGPCTVSGHDCPL